MSASAVILEIGGDEPPPDPKKPFWAKCQGCNHCWIAAFYPMEASKFAKIAMHSICPMCGSKRAFVAKQNDGQLQEPPA